MIDFWDYNFASFSNTLNFTGVHRLDSFMDLTKCAFCCEALKCFKAYVAKIYLLLIF